ncbi:MAG: PH domain-containing protein [Actinomycetota bacterium]|nr:PH domain-containing protein [Actinomycetota bacterium]
MEWIPALGVALGAILILPCLVYLSTRSRDLVDVEVSETQVTVRPKGLNKLWAFRKALFIPLSSIRSARVVSGRRHLPTGWRFPGTAIPGVIFAGTYVKSGERSFYAVRDGRDILLLELEGHTYRRIAVQTKDPFTVANRVTALLPSGSS